MAENTEKLVTANHLLDGDVIYLRADGTWTRRLDEAWSTADPVLADERRAQAGAAHIAVGCTLTEAARDGDGRLQPVHFREAFRMHGPSNRFLGKQRDLGVTLPPHFAHIAKGF